MIMIIEYRMDNRFILPVLRCIVVARVRIIMSQRERERNKKEEKEREMCVVCWCVFARVCVQGVVEMW